MPKYNRPVTLDAPALAKLKRSELIDLYEAWLTYHGSTLMPEFISNRKNTKQVIIDLIMAKQARRLDEIAEYEALASKIKKAGDSIQVKKSEPPLRPKSAPRSRRSWLIEKVDELYRNRPEFMPSHLRPIGVTGGGCL